MPNVEELLNQISTEKTKVLNEPLWISKVDLKYTYGQLELSEETNKNCNFAIRAGRMNGYYRFRKGFYGLSDFPTIFQKKTEN